MKVHWAERLILHELLRTVSSGRPCCFLTQPQNRAQNPLSSRLLLFTNHLVSLLRAHQTHCVSKNSHRNNWTVKMEGFKKKKKNYFGNTTNCYSCWSFFFFEKTGVNKSSDNSSFMLSNVLIIIFQVLIVKKIDNFSLIKLFIFSKSYASFFFFFNASLYVALENRWVHILVPLINEKLFSLMEWAFPPLFSSHKVCGDMTLSNFLKSFYFLI